MLSHGKERLDQKDLHAALALERSFRSLVRRLRKQAEYGAGQQPGPLALNLEALENEVPRIVVGCHELQASPPLDEFSLSERCALMRSLLSEDYPAYLRSRGLLRVSRRIRAQQRQTFLDLLEIYAREVFEAHKAEVHAIRRSREAGFERVFREDLTLRVYIQRLRLAAVLHWLRIGDAARIVDESLIAIDRLLSPRKVVALQGR